MLIKQMPEDERPRERLQKQGAVALSDAELLAIFLRTGLPGLNAIALAHQLLREFGSLFHLIRADRNRFCQQKGLGPAKFVSLQAVMEMARRCLSHKLYMESALSSSHTTRSYLQSLFYHCERELFLVLFLDSQYRLIRSETLFSGTFNRTTVHPREVVKAALTCNAAAIILAHNHLSSSIEPSPADYEVTELIVKACALVDIYVIDHFIVGIGGTLSFAEQGWIPSNK